MVTALYVCGATNRIVQRTHPTSREKMMTVPPATIGMTIAEMSGGREGGNGGGDGGRGKRGGPQSGRHGGGGDGGGDGGADGEMRIGTYAYTAPLL